jgi:hypothetical protein
MTNIEYRLFMFSAGSMAISMLMLLAVMGGIADPDTVRAPLMIAGMLASSTFTIFRAAQLLRRKRA